jgi:MSHA biogenesis protein MshN
MSVINKMLQGLEERRAEAERISPLHDQIRPAAVKPQHRSDKGVMTVLVMLLCGVLFWIWHESTAQGMSAIAMAAPIQSPAEGESSSSDMPSISARIAVAKEVSVLGGEGSLLESGNVLGPPAAEEENQSTASATERSAGESVEAKVEPAFSGNEGISEVTDHAAVAKSDEVAPPKPDLSKAVRRVEAKKTEGKKALSDSSNEAVAVAAQAPAASKARTPAVLAKKVRELSPQQQAENEYRRASVLIQQGRYHEAIILLEQALQFDPQHLPAVQTMAGVLIELKRYDEAIYRLQERLRTDRAHPSLAMMLARLQVGKGELRTAIDTLQNSLPYASQRADYQAFLAALYQREGQHKEAVERYMLALGNAPQNGIWWMGLGISLQAQNRVSEAREAYRQAKASDLPSRELQEFVDQRLTQLH